MRCVTLLSLVLCVVSCAPVQETEMSHAGRAQVVPVETPAAPLQPKPEPEIPSHPRTPLRATRMQVSGITFDGVAFDSREFRLVVVDQPGGPGSRFADAAAAARSVSGIAAVNGGFFTPEGEPLGLVITGGKRSGSWNSGSSLGSGVWHDSGASAISRREKLGREQASNMRELLQAGPMLVENHRAVSGLDTTKTSARTVILWDGGSRWWIGCNSPATLAQTANVLATAAVPGWQVRHALNLDGGRSSDLWISPQVSGGPLTQRPPWNRPVRNFLVLVPSA